MKKNKLLLTLSLIILASILFQLYLLFTQVKGFTQGDPYEYVSMAYKVVFNNKWEAWDIRSWFYPFFLMIPLMILKYFKVVPGNLFIRSIIVVQIIFSISCLIVTYFLGKKIKNTFTGLISVFFLALNPLFNRWSLSTTTDVPATLFYLLVLYFCIPDSNKKNLIDQFIGGLFMGIAFGIRYQSIFSFIPICFLYLKKPKRSLYFVLGFIVIFLLIGVVDQFIYGSLFHSLIANFKYNFSLQPIKDYGSVFWIQDKKFYFNSILFNFSFIEIFLIVISIISSFYKKNIFIIIFNFIFTFVIYNFIPHKESRFLVMLVPLMCILSAIGLDFIKFQITKIFKLPSVSFAFMGIILLITFFFQISKIKYIDLKPFGGVIDGITNITRHDKNPIIVAPIWATGKNFYFGENLKVIDLDPTKWKDKDLVNSALNQGHYFIAWDINSSEFENNVDPLLRANKYIIHHQYNGWIYLYKKQ